MPSELNGKIIRFAADGIGGVDRAGRINKKPGAGEFAVFVDRVNFDDRVAAAFEDGLDLAADRAGRVLLRAKRRGRLTRASRAANPAVRPGWKNERRAVLKIERRLITHGQPIKHITRRRRGSVSVGAFTDLTGEIGPETAG